MLNQMSQEEQLVRPEDVLPSPLLGHEAAEPRRNAGGPERQPDGSPSVLGVVIEPVQERVDLGAGSSPRHRRYPHT